MRLIISTFYLLACLHSLVLNVASLRIFYDVIIVGDIYNCVSTPMSFCFFLWRYLQSDFKNCIVITFYSPSCLGQGTAKGPFRSSSQAATCLPHTAKSSYCPFNCWTSSREAVNTNFYSLWYDPTGNRTQVYRFSSRRSTHSTTDRLNLIGRSLHQ